MQKPKRTRSMSQEYSVYFLPDEEAGGYTAHVPALGIVTEGETLREARTMVKDAIRGRVAVLKELGQPVPGDITTERVKV